MIFARLNTLLFKLKWDTRRVLRQGRVIFCLIIGSISSLTYAALPTPREYQVKAVYLFNFSKFMTWPDWVFNSPQAPIRICVLGKNPFDNFDKLVRGKKIRRRPVVVQYLRDYRTANICHTLFVSKSEEGNQATILAYVQQYPIVTVSDIKRFVTRGGMIQFYIRDNKVRFMIDPQTVQRAGISASANLLRVATIVE